MIDLLWRCFYRCAYVGQLIVHAVVRPRVIGAHVVVRVGDRVLLVKNSYRRALGFPAGRVDRGESVRHGAVRELFEEVGIRAATSDLRALPPVVTRHECKTDEAHLFELRLSSEPPLTIDRREVVWAGFVSIDELVDPSHGRRLHVPTRRWLESLRAAGVSNFDVAE